MRGVLLFNHLNEFHSTLFHNNTSVKMVMFLLQFEKFNKIWYLFL